MPTFHDPLVDAEEFSAAARGLAHASRSFAEPIDTYRVLGDLQSAMFSLHQSLQQIAAFHTRLADRASTDHGDRAAGREHALIAAMRLETAATHVDRATDHLMVAVAENGKIAWQPATAAAEVLAERDAEVEIDADANRSAADPPALGR